jgi:hypothetical protein
MPKKTPRHVVSLEAVYAPAKVIIRRDNGGELPETTPMIGRLGDAKFIKLFPSFTEAVLKAMRAGQLRGGADLLFYFMERTMTSAVNGTTDQIGILSPAGEIAETLGKSVRAVQSNIRVLLDLGFLVQPRRGVAIYFLEPQYAYRGSLLKLREKEKAGVKLAQPPRRLRKALRQAARRGC